MKQKLFLSSMLIMSVAPAMAEPSNTGEFPTGGLMQEDYTYTNAATSTNMDGVYSGTVNAVAEYDVINYIVNAGQYLPADSETVITCPAGSFCPGIDGNVQYNQTTPQGIQTCPTGYASSAAGASSDTQCYRQCSGNVTIEHATGVTGNDYYGNGTDTCEPTACENGWHVKAGVPNLTTAIGTGAGASYGYVNNAGEQKEQAAALGISDKNTWAVDYGTKGIIKGHGRCSTRDVANPWYNNNNTFESDHFVSNLADETGTGRYCYCQLDSYTPNGGTLQAVLSPWVFYNGLGSASNCASNCANYCANYMRNTNSGNLAWRAAIFGSIESGPAMCEANTITINWSNADANDISANNAGTATYGSDVRTPVKAQTIKGKTFKGWRFSKPQQVQTCAKITDQSTCTNSNCEWSFGKCLYKYEVVPEEIPESYGSSD